MKLHSLSMLLILPFANAVLANADVAPAASNAKTFECKDDGLKVELALRSPAAADAATPPITYLRTNGRNTDPTTFNYINSLADGRVIERMESSCKDKSLEVVMHLAPVPSEKRDSITVTAWATTVKVH